MILWPIPAHSGGAGAGDSGGAGGAGDSGGDGGGDGAESCSVQSEGGCGGAGSQPIAAHAPAADSEAWDFGPTCVTARDPRRVELSDARSSRVVPPDGDDISAVPPDGDAISAVPPDGDAISGACAAREARRVGGDEIAARGSARGLPPPDSAVQAVAAVQAESVVQAV